MSTPTNCNHDPKSHKFYDGCLGYEALVCRECGAYCDHNGAHPADDWSRSFVGINLTLDERTPQDPATRTLALSLIMECPVPPCPEGVPYDNHLVDCNCD